MTLILLLFAVQINDDHVFCEGDTHNIAKHPHNHMLGPYVCRCAINGL